MNIIDKWRFQVGPWDGAELDDPFCFHLAPEVHARGSQSFCSGWKIVGNSGEPRPPVALNRRQITIARRPYSGLNLHVASEVVKMAQDEGEGPNMFEANSRGSICTSPKAAMDV